LPMMRMGGRTTERGAEMARTASFCFGFSFGSKQKRQDVRERGRDSQNCFFLLPIQLSK
jgi:hypothetical protein